MQSGTNVWNVGGFSVEDDQTALLPTAPVTNEGNNKLVFEFTRSPYDGAANIKDKIPQVLRNRAENWQKPIGTEVLHYPS